MKGWCEGVIREEKVRKKNSFPQEEVAKDKAEGQSLPGPLLPAEAAAARDAPSSPLAHHPLAPFGGLGPLRFTPIPLLSPYQETKCPFTMRPSVPLPGDHASLWPEVENCPSPASFLPPKWWEVAGACPPLLQAEEQRACSHASATRPTSAESLPRVGHFMPLCCVLIGKLAAGIHEQSTGLCHCSLKQPSSLKVTPQVAFSLLKHQLKWSQNGSHKTWHMPLLPRNLQAAHSCFNSARTCCDSLSHNWNKTSTLCQLAALAGVLTFQSLTAVSNIIFTWWWWIWLPFMEWMERMHGSIMFVLCQGVLLWRHWDTSNHLSLGWQGQELTSGPWSQWKKSYWAEQSTMISEGQRTVSSPRLFKGNLFR